MDVTVADVRKVAAARLWAATRYPYLASALFASPFVFVEGIGTVAADSTWLLYGDPEVVRAWSVEGLGARLVHHAGHLLREHASRAAEAGVGDEEAATAWMVAADAEINDDLVAELDFAEPPVVPADLDAPDGRLAEAYYDVARHAKVGCSECGSAAHGQHRSWENPEDARAMSPNRANLLRKQVAGEILNHGKEAGKVPAGLRRWAEAFLQPVVDWRAVLAAEIRRGLTEVAGRTDYSYRRPSRRASAVADVVLPALRRRVPEVAVICDTSGSMSEGDLGRVLSEVDGVIRSVGVGAGSVSVLAVDTSVHSAGRVTSSLQVELYGGGGTDMGRGIEAAMDRRPRPDVVVVLTDGYTPWPEAGPRGASVIVGLLGRDAPTAPAWARSVRVVDG